MDDCVIFVSADSKKEVYSLLEARLELLAGWAEDDCVLFNVMKCEVFPHCATSKPKYCPPIFVYQSKSTSLTLKPISRQPWNLTNHLKDLGHEIRQRSTIFGYLRTPLFKLSLPTLRTLFSGSFLGKIRFLILSWRITKPTMKNTKFVFELRWRHLAGLHKSCPNSVLYDAYVFNPLFHERLVLNLSHPAARIFFDWVESDDQNHCRTISFTAERYLLSEYPVLALDMLEFRDSIHLPEGFGKHDYLLSLETPTTNGLFASDMQLD
jgi:hypothetical protein